MLYLAPGRPFPLGASLVGAGVNFALFSRHASAVSLLLYESAEAVWPTRRVDLDPSRHRDGDIWHIWVAQVHAGWAYAYQIDGPHDLRQGLRYDPQCLLLDPYASALTAVSAADLDRARDDDLEAMEEDVALGPDDNQGSAARAVVIDHGFDWQGDRPLKLPWSQTILYEVHVRGFTAHPSSGVQHPGTCRGLIEKIPYLQSLGISAVELLPVHEFNEHELSRANPITGEPLRNYWGYSTVGYFAPKETYAVQAGAQVTEFKEMVRAMHSAGIEVILDVVFNHTAEGNEHGPTLSFRGIDNPIYYLLEEDRAHYKNYSGCGNTVNCNHPVVRDLILDCLRHWVIDMHVDGFRFDLASILGRDAEGNVASNPPLLERIAEDPILRDVKLIAEAWDPGGAWQVGRFAGQRWSEWNCHFRDEVRRFWRGDPGARGGFASRLCGSADLYQASGKQPLNSVNFITCHDGFTLNDLVSYARKHNEANGEDNRDGTDANFSDNYGVEGESRDSRIEALRLRQLKNLIATLFLSRGVPMLLGGDEFRRTQRGNNNAYCQDNELSWHDWSLLERNGELLRFTRELVALRKRHAVLTTEQFYEARDITWCDPSGGYPDWHDAACTLGCVIHGQRVGDAELCLLFNAEPHAVDFQLPPAPAGQEWQVVVDTAQLAPADLPSGPGGELRAVQLTMTLKDRSLVVLLATESLSMSRQVEV